jgi:hypothetical protein
MLDPPRQHRIDVIVVTMHAMERHVERGADDGWRCIALCDAALVTVMQPADLRDGDNRSEGGDWPRDWTVLRQSEVGAGVVVVRLVLREDSSQAGLVEHDDVIETLAPDGARTVPAVGRRPSRQP